MSSFGQFNLDVPRFSAKKFQSKLFLAFWTEIARTSALFDTFNRCLASRTRIFFAVVDAPAQFVAAAVVTAVDAFGIDVKRRAVRN